MVTNAGYGGVQFAIQNGVQLIVAGTTEDKPEVCARVEWSEIGINLKTDQPSEESIANAVDELLANDRYKDNVKRLQQEFLSYEAYKLSVEYLENMVSQ